MRVSIALKIFGIALTLLVFLAVASVFSTLNVRRVADEVESIGHYFTPISQSTSRVQIGQLHQALVLERLLERYAAVARADTTVAEAEAEMVRLGKQIDDELANALQLVEQGFASSTSEQDRTEFGQMRPVLHTITKEHQDYEDRARSIIRALDDGQQTRADTLREVLAKEETELLGELDDLRSHLQELTRASIQESAHHEAQILRINIFMTIGAALSGLLFASLVTSGLMRPIHRLVAGTKAIEEGRLDTSVPVTSGDEIGVLTQSFNAMVGELRLKERIKDTFGKYVDPRIVEDLLQRPDLSGQEGDRRVVTVFFSDIEGFTSISERLTPSGLVKVINTYFTMMSEPITTNGGIIDKFIGDGIMAFWAPPFVPAEEQAARACFAALEQLELVTSFQRMIPELIGVRTAVPQVRIRIGMATGDVVIGNIGSEKFHGYTVMGDPVNLGSRLESAAKQYGVRILISEQTYRLAAASIEARELDVLRVTGKTEPACVYELLGRRTAIDARRAALRDKYQEALAQYRARRWDMAAQLFQACVALDPDDVPSQLFVQRATHFQNSPPPDDWDGVWTLEHK
jgi:class 3 adenylate cyclase